ncbi:MAG: ATP-dependent Clp protease ATP-binding subunit, partial [Clostridia bacterium]|nr:ATP-dependent Clp protease ATP-binding subunit [Clostridia bacterium]
MVCSRCKKRPAVVFITRMEGDNSVNEGLCLTCAKELGIKPVDDLLTKFGIGQEELEQMDEQLGELMNPEDGEDGDFMPGGAATFPFLQNLFGGQAPANAENSESADKKEKPKKDKKRKALALYCTDLTQKAR